MQASLLSLKKNLNVYLISSCFFSTTLSLSNSGDCLKVLSCSSGSCFTALSAIFDISFMSVIVSSNCIFVLISSSPAGSSFLNIFCSIPSFCGFSALLSSS